MQSLNKLMGTTHLKTLPYAPFTNGLTEKAIQVAATHLRKILTDSLMTRATVCQQ